jgi:phosphoribulokinase
MHRDTRTRGYSQEAVMDTVERRLSDYVHFITPQFSLTDVNFQRVPMVDTSNPFEEQEPPTLNESKIVIRFRNPKQAPYSLPELIEEIPGAFMSRRNNLVVPGSEFELAMQVVLEPLVGRLLELRASTG